MAVSIRLLGPPRVERDGEPVSFDTRKATALLAHLAVTERPRSRDALCELLWPGQDTERARGALRRTLSTLRGAIGEEWIETQGDSIGLRREDGFELDVERFRRLAAERDSPESLAEAAEACSGSLLEGFALRDSPTFEQWHMAEARGLDAELTAVLQRLVELLVANRDYTTALRYARRWLDAEPLHEAAHRELIRLYALSGDRAAALNQYRDCVRVLSQELGVAPVDETSVLFEQVSEGTLVPSEPAPVAAPTTTSKAAPSGELPFVGRSAEMDALIAAMAAVDGDGRLVVVEGEAGIGKTRLVEEFARSAEAAGSEIVAARCRDASPGLPYAPILELLRQRLATAEDWVELVAAQRLADASLLVPELRELRAELPIPLSISGPVAQARLLDGVAAVLGAAAPGAAPALIFVDDVHAADAATLDVLAYLVQRLRGWPNVLVLSWRSEYMPPGHRLRRLAGELARAGVATTLRLERLSEAEVTELVGSGHAAGPELAERIYLESEGLPLFVVEYLAATPADEEGRPPTFPREVRTALENRLNDLEPISLQVVGAAAVLGSRFSFATLRSTSGRDYEETVDALEELLAKALLREIPDSEGEYDFSHQKLRELIYEEVSPPRRRLLHLRAARALPADPATAALVAQHLREAGEEGEAAEHYRVAAEHAVSLHAHADALGYLQAALACDEAGDGELHERIGDLQTRLGDYAAAHASYEAAASVAEGASLAALWEKVATVHERRGEWDRAEARLIAALDATPPTAPGLRARIEADLALTLHRLGRFDAALERATEASSVAAAAEDPRAMAQAQNLLGMLARSGGQLDTASGHLEASLVLSEEMEDKPARVAALNNLALVARDGGDLEQALELTDAALRACRGYGDRHREAALENNMADLHHAAGRPDDAMTHLKRAVSIFAEVGGDEATRLPEIWKLVSW
jgi:DNA-binding SARP family transcriptional activator/predicted ATPase